VVLAMGVSAKFLAGLAVSAALVPAVVSEDVSAAPMTFKVTSASCTGPGSIVAAVEAANKNPGTDTIEFTPGLRVQADNYSCGSDHDKWIADVTESVTFEGNGARLVGAINWITPGGKVRPLSKCPDEHDSTDTMVALSPGFLSVGDGRSGPPGISVTVNNLRLDTLNSIADFVSDQGSLTMNNVRAKNILSHQFGCNTPAIGVRDASLTIRRSVWDLLVNWSGQPYPPVITGEAIQGWNTGDLTIEDSQFADVGRGGFINWTGAAGSTVDIVSTRMLQVGSITVFNGTTNIVNSVWVHSRDPSNLADMIINASPEPMNIVASTVLVSDARCGTACAQLDADGTVRQWEDDDGPVNLTQSAIGVPSDSSGTRSSVIANADVSASGGFSADADTWIQPLADQDAAALKTLTGQPALLTDPPGLVTGQFGFAPSFVSPLLGTTAAPGQLIDKIPDSACGGANELINPIDGKCIDEDVFGNSRWDTGNEARNIGAVQLTLAPHLAVDATGDGTVDLGWNRPVDGLGDKVKGYVVRSRPAGSSGPFTELAVTGPDSLWVQVKGLTNGTLYEFEVSAVRATAGAGPASNLATATPYGPVGAPVVTAQRQPGKITLFWTEPPSGGHSGPLYYTVVYRPVGEQTWLPGPGFLSGRTTFIPGLRTDTEYEFGVFATTFDRQVSGLLGTTTVAGVCRGKVATIMGTPGDDVLDGTAGPVTTSSVSERATTRPTAEMATTSSTAAAAPTWSRAAQTTTCYSATSTPTRCTVAPVVTPFGDRTVTTSSRAATAATSLAAARATIRSVAGSSVTRSRAVPAPMNSSATSTATPSAAPPGPTRSAVDMDATPSEAVAATTSCTATNPATPSPEPPAATPLEADRVKTRSVAATTPTRSAVVTIATRSAAATAPTSCTATTSPTPSPAETATTTSTVAPGTTPVTADRAGTRLSAASPASAAPEHSPTSEPDPDSTTATTRLTSGPPHPDPTSHSDCPEWRDREIPHSGLERYVHAPAGPHGRPGPSSVTAG